MHGNRRRSLIATGEHTPERKCVPRRTFMKGMGFAILGSIPLLGGCGIPSSEEESMRSTKGKNLADPAKRGVVGDTTIPPIDASVPEKTGTATFALG